MASERVEFGMAVLARDFISDLVGKGIRRELDLGMELDGRLVAGVQASSALMKEYMDKNLIYIYCGQFVEGPPFSFSNTYLSEEDKQLIKIEVHPEVIGDSFGLSSLSEVRMQDFRGTFFLNTMPGVLGRFNTLEHLGYRFQATDYSDPGGQEK